MLVIGVEASVHRQRRLVKCEQGKIRHWEVWLPEMFKLAAGEASGDSDCQSAATLVA